MRKVEHDSVGIKKKKFIKNKFDFSVSHIEIYIYIFVSLKKIIEKNFKINLSTILIIKIFPKFPEVSVFFFLKFRR